MRTLLLAVLLLQPLVRFDHDIQDAVQAGRRPWLERPMRMATEVSKPVFVGGILAIVLAADLASGGGFSTLRLAVVAALGTNAVVEPVKAIVNRTRPDGEHRRSNASFPSGHAATAFSIAWVLALRWRRLFPLWFLLAATVAFSRMYLNRHYLSDVLAGAALGMLVAWLASRWLPLRRGLPRPRRDGPVG